MTKTNANDTVTVEMRHNARICAIDLRWRLVRTKEEAHGCDEQQNLGKSETDSEGKKLSLDSMAEQTGVSKSMLGQIERGESSPTVATLWKIATGLHISFTALLEGRQTETQLIRKGEVSPLLSDEGRFRLFPFFPYDAERRFEMLSIELEPGTRSESVPHEDGTEEFVLVFEGALRLTVDGVEYVVEAGEGIRYLANKPHIYECHGTQKTKICMVIYYDK